MIPSFLVLTNTHVIKLRELPGQGRPEEAVVLWRRELGAILRITAKKKHPNLISIAFDGGRTPLSPSAASTPTAAAPAADTPKTPKTPLANIGFSIDDGPDTPTTSAAINAVGSAKAAAAEAAATEAAAAKPAEPEAAAPAAATAPSSDPSTPERKASSDKGGPVERFMIPEATEAKAAFRTLIGRLREQTGANGGAAAAAAASS